MGVLEGGGIAAIYYFACVGLFFSVDREICGCILWRHATYSPAILCPVNSGICREVHYLDHPPCRFADASYCNTESHSTNCRARNDVVKVGQCRTPKFPG